MISGWASWAEQEEAGESQIGGTRGRASQWGGTYGWVNGWLTRSDWRGDGREGDPVQ